MGAATSPSTRHSSAPQLGQAPANWRGGQVRRARRRSRAHRPRTPPRASPGTAGGRAGTAPAPAGRSRAGRKPSACRRGTSPPPGTSSGHADGDTHAHNTLSADNTDVQVFYPFHPLHTARLRVVRRPDRGDGAVCVMDPAGKRLKIPVWMLLPESAEIKISQQPHLGKQALLSLASLITPQLVCEDRVHDNLLPTNVGGCEEGRRAATSTSGPDDPKGTRCRANRRSDTRRCDRSHGPHFSSGLSRGGGKSQ